MKLEALEKFFSGWRGCGVSGRLLEGKERVRDLRVELDERYLVIGRHCGSDTTWAAAILQGVRDLEETASLQILSLAGQRQGLQPLCRSLLIAQRPYAKRKASTFPKTSEPV